jgi:general secretion pathway protein C
MSSRLLSLLIWALVAASALAWGLKLLVRPAAVPAHATTARATAPVSGPIERLFGQPVAAPPPEALPAAPASDRFKLLGVVAARPGGAAGWALISVDGLPPRAVALGREVEPGLRLLSVTHRRVELGAASGGPPMVLELPPLAEAARGQLADASAMPAAPRPVATTHGAAVAAPAAAPAAALTAPAQGTTPTLAAGPTAGFRGMPPATPPRTSIPSPTTMQAAQQLAQQAAAHAAQVAQQAAQQAAGQAPAMPLPTETSEQGATPPETRSPTSRSVPPLR